jgi:outer membrane protein assembly factor BamB
MPAVPNRRVATRAGGILAGSALLVLALVPTAGASTEGVTQWVKRYGGREAEVAHCVAVSPDGTRVFVTGSRNGAGTDSDYATVAYDASTGHTLWVRRDDTGYLAASIVVSPDGSKVFVTGVAASDTGGDYATIAYDALTGATLWAKFYNGPGNRGDQALSIAVSPDGSKVIATGYVSAFGNAGGYDDYGTVAYDASTGAMLWVRRYNGPANYDDTAYSVAVSGDGSKVFVTGRSYASGNGDDYATVAYDASTGATLWVRRYNGPGDSADEAYSVAATSDGSKVFVTGYSIGTGADLQDYATVAYDASTGATLWVRRYNGPATDISEDEASSLAVSHDGSNVFVTGYSVGANGGGDFATVSYDAATGATKWVRRYDGTGGGGNGGKAIATSPDGSKVFVTGYSGGTSGNPDYATVAYDSATGARLWVKRYNGTGNGYDDPYSIAVSPDGGSVFVTGVSSGNTTGFDYATVAYSADAS